MPTEVSRRAPSSSQLTARQLKPRADRMLQALGIADAELSVLLTDDTRIRELNREHRQKDQATDVLAFALEEADEVTGSHAGPVRVLGDVVISLDTALRQARKRRHSLMDEVTFLLAHGLLHLVGYDHETDEQEAEMTAETRRLVRESTARGAVSAPPLQKKA